MAKTLDEAGVKRLIQEIKGANKNLNAPITISTENTTESKAQNVKNIADFVAKAKAAGIADVNGMGVTCIIDGENSGVGYLYVTNTQVLICGILAYEDNSVSCISVIDGTYSESSIVVEGHIGQITSDMLVEGARKPIILTPSTTEVDEETYQKLLSDNVDVVFKDASDVLYHIYDIDNKVSDLEIRFVTTLGSIDTTDPSDYWFSVAFVRISENAPHTVTTESTDHSLQDVLNDSGYLNKSTLSPVLQEIDLTGTDADRKAKLDQFETDWKALTGASDLTGARFVGQITTPKGGYASVLFTYNIDIDTFTGVTNLDDSDYRNHYSVYLNSQGALTITPLFSHLEAITIYTDNTPEHKQANLDNIAAYEANLQALGVDTTKGCTIPIVCSPSMYCGILFGRGDDYYEGVCNSHTTRVTLGVAINVDGAFFATNNINTISEYQNLTTIDKKIIPAINEVNALAEKKADKSLNAKSLEAITIKSRNATSDKVDNKAAIKAYVDNLKALGVDTTKGYMIPVKLANGYHGFIMGTDADGEHTGVIKRSKYNYGGGWIFIDNIGTYNYLECLTSGSYDDLTTTAKTIVPAINEINTLAKGYSTLLAPIELTTDPAQNKTAIDARVAAFTAQGISLTNGCCIPVTYKGVYAGNINLINGDWYGLLVKNTNNPADNINIKLSADGTITEGNSAQ